MLSVVGLHTLAASDHHAVTLEAAPILHWSNLHSLASLAVTTRVILWTILYPTITSLLLSSHTLDNVDDCKTTAYAAKQRENHAHDCPNCVLFS